MYSSKRITDNLIIAFRKPHSNASSDTISKWVREEILAAATDITYFKAHRCRGASSRKADQIGISVKKDPKNRLFEKRKYISKFLL